jgi:hypothetical protein
MMPLAGVQPSRTGRVGGFTLVELLVVSVVGIIILSGVVRVLVSTQQVYTAQTARIGSQQTVRAGLGVLFGEIREVSPRGGDLITMQPNEVQVRVMRTVGYACQVSYAATPSVTTGRLGSWFNDGDSLFVFAENNPNIQGDDRFLRGLTSVVDTTATCPDGSPGQQLMLPGMAAAMAVDSVRVGALVRSFEHVTYGLFQEGSGEWYLGQRRAGAGWEPLVGPLRAPDNDAPLFRYLNEAGAVTATAAQVRQVEVTLRSDSRARGPGGVVIRDSVSARIQARN